MQSTKRHGTGGLSPAIMRHFNSFRLLGRQGNDWENKGLEMVCMKKARGSGMKGGGAPKDIDEYLAGVPEPARSTLNKVRATIRSVVPAEATEAISYGMPTFKYKGSLVALGAFSKHCSLFPMNSSLIKTFKNELRGFQTAKGTIRFPT